MRAWWFTRTLRFRLALWQALAAGILLTGFSATLYFYVEERMARPLDHALRLDLREVLAGLEVKPDRTVWWHGRELPELAVAETEYPWFEVWDGERRLVRRFWPFTSEQVALTPAAPTPGRETISIFNVAPDLRLRVLSVPYQAANGQDGWMLRLMRIHQPTADALGALRLIILVALPVGIAFLVIGGFVITRRWLKPLDVLGAEADRITAHDLSRRLPVANPHDELGRLASVFNVTLDRLQSSFEALDRFVADASHELRTPLTTLRSVGEVGLRRSRTVDEYREIIGSMLEEAQRLEQLIHRLLELATAEGGAPQVHRTPVALDTFVANCVGELSVLAEAKNQRVSVNVVSCTLQTDPVLLRQALQNLLDNAIKYSPAGSPIAVRLTATDAEARITVTDAGPGISPENRAQLMERFFRPDRGRGRQSGGFGLGLSITKAYMRVLGGRLVYEPGESTGSTFGLTLPRN